MNSTMKKFLWGHSVEESSLYHTHTSIDPKGKYMIGSDAMEDFWKLYQDLLEEDDNVVLSITELPQPYLPVLADFDISITEDEDIEIGDTLYTEEHVKNVIKIYQDVLRNTVDDCTDEQLLCGLLEKPISSTYDEKKDITVYKRGFHLHFFNVFLSTKSQKEHIIPRVINELKSFNVFEDLGVLSSDKLLDDCHIKNPWLLYGSRKNASKAPYKLTKIYNAELEEVEINEAFKHYQIFDKNEQLINMNGRAKYYLPRILSTAPHGRKTSEIKYGIISPLAQKNQNGGPDKKKKVYVSVAVQDALKISAQLLPMLADHRVSDRNEWINIGWILFNISEGSEEGFNQWVEFSEREPDKFDEGVCQNEWDKMTKKGYTIGSLKHYAQIDNPELYGKWKDEHSRQFTKKILDDGTHYDIAISLYEDYSNEFRFDIKSGTWYRFYNHKWKIEHDGASLQERIPKNIVEKIDTEINKTFSSQNNGANLSDKAGQKTYTEKIKQYNKVKANCKSDSFQSCVMKQCRIIFRDENFEAKLDQDKYKIVFGNGVYDLKNNVFRCGRPEDYLSKSMPIDYIDFDMDDDKVRSVERFFEQIMPNISLRRYFIDQMSDIFEGGNKKKTVHFWTGEGDNGKSITQSIFEQMFGKYAIKLSTTVATGKKVQNGAANPELARAGGGVRWAVMEEPDKTEELNIGILKSISGDDSYFARDLFQKGSDVKEIKPMFKVTFISNGLPYVKNSDKAFWNRVRVVPFESTFVRVDDENPAPVSYDEQMMEKRFPRDENFGDKIPGLLQAFAWYLLKHRVELIKGKKKRQPDPEIVRTATLEYQKQNDAYRKFIDENYVADSKAVLTSIELYNDFKQWYKDANPGSVLPIRAEVEKYFTKIWGEPMAGIKWRGYRKKSLQDEIASGEALYVEEEDLVNYNPPL